MNSRTTAILWVFLCLCGCAARHGADEPVHPHTFGLLVPDLIEEKFYRFYKRRASKEEIFRQIAQPPAMLVPDEAFLDTLVPAADETVSDVPPATRTRWKQEYRQSAATYYVAAEDNNTLLLFFDASGRLRQYEHVLF